MLKINKNINCNKINLELQEKNKELEKYKRIIEHMGESIWIGDENERTVYANPNFCNIMEYSLSEMIGRESYDFRENESAKIVKNNNLKRKKGEASKYEGILKSKSGKLIPVLCSGTPIPGGGTVGIMTDLRELNKLKETEKKLKDLNKSKDEFISIVGHELRTPLTITDGYLSMIIEGDMGNLNIDIKKNLEKIYKSNKSLIKLVNDMLDLSKIQLGSLSFFDEKLDILELTENIFNDLKFIYKDKNISFSFNKIGKFENKIILIDSNRFRQVIFNLVNNSFKFTNLGGKIELNILDLGNFFQFEVIDNGIGIKKSELKKIFYKFHQVESYFSRTNQGLGLGLSIISGIINYYNSKIEIESTLGKGTKIFFKIKK